MSALVVYESMFGSTRAVAEAIGEGLERAGTVRVVEVGALVAGAGGGEVGAVDLLVVGGPTHAFSMSRESTRADAVKQSPDGTVISARTGVREWLVDVALTPGTRIAAFDTKAKVKVPLPGSAARSIERALRQKGGTPADKARTFWVEGRSGLLPGELDAARAWGAQLASALTTA